MLLGADFGCSLLCRGVSLLPVASTSGAQASESLNFPDEEKGRGALGFRV